MKQILIQPSLTKAQELWDALNTLSVAIPNLDLKKEFEALNKIISELQQKLQE